MKSLREWRAEKLLTIRDLASKANVANQTIVQIEHGRISPRIRTIRRLSSALGLDPAEISEFEDAIRRSAEDTDDEDGIDEEDPPLQRSRLQPLLDAMPETELEGVSGAETFGLLLGKNGELEYASPSLVRILGDDARWTGGEDIFDTIIQFVHPDDQYETMRLIHFLLVTPGAVDEIIHRVRFPDSQWRDMRLHGTNLVDHPAVEGVLFVASRLEDDEPDGAA